MPPTGGGSETGGSGNEAGGAESSWEINEEGAASGDDGTGSEPVTGGDQDEGESQVDALERALGELDGEILDERITTVENEPGPGRGGTESAGDAPLPAPPVAEPELARVPTPLPPDRPDARDDDVVARQLREAAMAETDPELREQLWEEYRRYKSGL